MKISIVVVWHSMYGKSMNGIESLIASWSQPKFHPTAPLLHPVVQCVAAGHAQLRGRRHVVLSELSVTVSVSVLGRAGKHGTRERTENEDTYGKG